MTYRNMANLATDTEFGRRLAAGLASEAALKPSDYLVDQIMMNPDVGKAWFMPFIMVAPGFADEYGAGGQDAIEDAELLSAIQAVWPRVFELYEPEVTP